LLVGKKVSKPACAGRERKPVNLPAGRQGFFYFSNFIIIRWNLGPVGRLRTLITRKKNLEKHFNGIINHFKG